MARSSPLSRRHLVALLISPLLVFASPSTEARDLDGSSCKKSGLQQLQERDLYTCVTVGRTFRWKLTNDNTSSFKPFPINGPTWQQLADIRDTEAKKALEQLAIEQAEAKAAAELKAKQEAELKAKQEAEAKAAAELKAKQDVEAKAAATKKITITCVKGKIIKKVSGVKPRCPAGYKKK